MNKKTIALVLDTWDYPFNGLVVSNKRFIENLENNGFEFVIFALGEGKNDSLKRVSFNNLPIYGLNHILEKMRSPFAMPNKEKIREALKTCDVVSVQYPFFLGGKVITVAKEMGIPVVCSFHVQPENILRNLSMESNWLVASMYKGFNHFFYNRADIVVAPSPFAASLLEKHQVKRPVKVISNGVPDRFLKIGEKPKLQKSRLQVLTVGRLAKEKHQDLIIKAVQLSKYKDQIDLHLVGAGPQLKNLQKLARKSSVNITIGNVSDAELNNLYESADLFVHASEAELEGMSVLEAMASSIAVVVANAKGSAAKDLVVDDNSLFEFPNVLDLRDKIDMWLGDEKLRTQGQKANHKQALRYSHQRSSNDFRELYDSLMQVGN